MQKAVYRIRFVSGELSGRTFLIPPDGILIGKSRSAAIRPGDEEIGIEHASLRYDEKGALVLEALAEKVAVRGTPLEPKAECRLEPGSDVMLGDRLSFVVEEEDAPAVPPPPPGSTRRTRRPSTTPRIPPAMPAGRRKRRRAAAGRDMLPHWNWTICGR